MHSLIKTLPRNRKLVPATFLVGATTLIVLVNLQVSQSSETNAAISLAGRQTMLNQKYTREVVDAAHGAHSDYEKTLQLQRSSLSLLRVGGDDDLGQVPAATDPELQSILATHAAEIDRHEILANELLSAAKDDRDLAQRQLAEHTAVVQQHAHAVVTRLVEISASSLSVTQVTCTVLGLLLGAISCGVVLASGESVAESVRVSADQFRNLSTAQPTTVSRTLRASAEATSAKATAASTVAAQLCTNAGALTKAVEEFENSIREISGNSSNAVSVAGQAVDAASSTNTTIARLGESSTEIGNVIQLINSIAEQTNLLALNATIEAARAGEAGKGFAVVANEVKELAKETSRATEEIGRRVETIQADTQQAVDAIALVGDIIGQISENQTAIATAVEQQTSMAADITQSISAVTSGSDQLVRSISAVAESAQATAAGSDETMVADFNCEDVASELLGAFKPASGAA